MVHRILEFNGNLLKKESCQNSFIIDCCFFMIAYNIILEIACETLHTGLAQGFLVVGVNLHYKNLTITMKQKTKFLCR